jgi:hypothetical protein
LHLGRCRVKGSGFDIGLPPKLCIAANDAIKISNRDT